MVGPQPHTGSVGQVCPPHSQLSPQIGDATVAEAALHHECYDFCQLAKDLPSTLDIHVTSEAVEGMRIVVSRSDESVSAWGEVAEENIIFFLRTLSSKTVNSFSIRKTALSSLAEPVKADTNR